MFTTRVLKLGTQRILQCTRATSICGAKRTLVTTTARATGTYSHRHNSSIGSIGNEIVGQLSMAGKQVRFNSIMSNTDGTVVPEDVAKLSIDEYHEYADETFEQILEELDAFFEEQRIMEAEVDEEAGVMEINCSEGTYVINKQPPTKQIWLSSPISGPKRFDYHLGEWVCLRDGSKLADLLQDEMSQMYGDFKWSKPF